MSKEDYKTKFLEFLKILEFPRPKEMIELPLEDIIAIAEATRAIILLKRGITEISKN